MASPSPRLFVLLNHQLTPDQRRALSSELGVGEVVLFPPELRELWRQIPADLPELSPLLHPLREWLAARARPGDCLLVQGDFGATFLMVQFAREQGLVPVYAATQRESREEPQPDGSVRTTRRFEHRRFRKYGV
jgi:hypothetical protein